MIDITVFNKICVIDTCSILNIMSSSILYNRSIEEKCFLSMTKYVEYECVVKPRSKPAIEEVMMREKLKKEIEKGCFEVHPLSIEDIQDVKILEIRRRLGKGELSSIAFAKKTNQAIITDDQKARKFAMEYLGNDRVQTIPQLLGYFIYKGIVFDGEMEDIIREHNGNQRPLEQYFREVYRDALKIRLMTRKML